MKYELKCGSCVHADVCLFKEKYANVVNEVVAKAEACHSCVSGVDLSCRFYESRPLYHFRKFQQENEDGDISG